MCFNTWIKWVVIFYPSITIISYKLYQLFSNAEQYINNYIISSASGRL